MSKNSYICVIFSVLIPVTWRREAFTRGSPSRKMETRSLHAVYHSRKMETRSLHAVYHSREMETRSLHAVYHSREMKTRSLHAVYHSREMKTRSLHAGLVMPCGLSDSGPMATKLSQIPLIEREISPWTPQRYRS